MQTMTHTDELVVSVNLPSNPACGCKGLRHCLVCSPSKSHAARESSNSAIEITLDVCWRCCVVFNAANKAASTIDDAPSLYRFCDACRQHNEAPQEIYARAVSVTCQSLSACAEKHNVKLGSTWRDGRNFGVFIFPNYISLSEESEMIRCIDSKCWNVSQSGRRKQDYGPTVNFKKRKVKMEKFQGLPSFANIFAERFRLRSEGLLGSVRSDWSNSGSVATPPDILCDFVPVELSCLEYIGDRGSHIVPHKDDTWLWGERFVIVNLGSGTYMSFSDPNSSVPVRVRVPLPERSLLVVAGPARFDWLHEIRPEDITGRRVSVTMRELSKQFSQGGESWNVGREILKRAAVTVYDENDGTDTNSA